MKYTPADLESYRLALYDLTGDRRSRKIDAGMKINSLRRRLGVEVLEEMKRELKKAGRA